jgi:hypothetical protein
MVLAGQLYFYTVFCEAPRVLPSIVISIPENKLKHVAIFWQMSSEGFSESLKTVTLKEFVMKVNDFEPRYHSMGFVAELLEYGRSSRLSN